ncbi:gliding motility-associated C-terminal domain-containing protein [Chitinophaga sp. CF118]|uniref:gliding motility-associated C-terminal domain-containing protein n=1 Tax=Chitinophaga sp. CF118 TaxID=1884367 RepID=UPI0008E0CA74|nr:gliding motility-associated C-terminal domain-containing protein [Chitinophaga sp. CF118]SFE13724.1 gliding motility-associated C-terminal domain-containing protein [Chitinophaga sp. CF118]
MRNLYLLIVVIVFVLGSTTARAATPFTFTTTCLNDNVKFNIAMADQTGIDSLKWNYGDMASGIKDTSSAMQGAHIYTVASTYTVTLVVFRSGVQDLTTMDITIVTPVVYDFGPQDQTICDGATLTLTAPTVAGATYEWQDSSTGQSIIADTTATYKVKINGCLIQDSVNVYFTPIPELDLGEDVILCLGETLQLDATAQNCTFLWSTGATTPDIIVHSDVATPTIPYIVTADAQGCGIYKDTINITFAGAPHPFSLGPDTLLCPGESVTFSAETPGATAYRWSNGSRIVTATVRSRWDLHVFVTINGVCDVLDTVKVRFYALGDVNLGGDTVVCKGETLVLTADFGNGTYRWQDTSKQATYYVREPGYYYVRAVIGRCVSSDTVRVLFDDTLHVRLGPDTTLCNGEVFKLYPAGAGWQYKWQDSSFVPVYSVTTPGIYALVSSNTCGQTVDSIEIDFKDCSSQVYIPSAFSPNGDGLNDYWRPKYRGVITNFQMSVWDRWGERVYYTTDPQVGWTGTKQGKSLPTGTYIWVMEYTSGDTNQKVKKNGTITIVY